MARTPEGNDGEDRERGETELMLALRRAVLRRIGILVQDARQLERIAAQSARQQDLQLRDRYVLSAPHKTPLLDAVAVLLTPNGRRLHSSDAVRHYLIYQPAEDGSVLEDGLPRIAWLERVEPDKTAQMFTLTEEDAQEASDDFETPARSLELQELRELHNDVSSYLPTPQKYSE